VLKRVDEEGGKGFSEVRRGKCARSNFEAKKEEEEEEEEEMVVEEFS
jgi:phosphoribosylformylglycinamidine (FGAM) synthase PurS component